MYAGKIDLQNVDGSCSLGVLVASDELLLDELYNFVEDHLIKNQSNWIKENYVKVLHTIYLLPKCVKLKDYCLNSICDSPKPFFTSTNFPTLEEDVLLDLLKRNDLDMEEIDVWNSLIEWGIHQTDEMDSKTDVTTWSKDNFEALKNKLSKFIELVRFYEISSADFFYKVRPYKSILPSDLYEDIVSYHMATSTPKYPNLVSRYNIKFDSTLLTKGQLKIIIGWIKNQQKTKSVSSKNKFISFTLLYRGSRDGIQNSSFNGRRANQGSCLVVTKCSQTNKIIGGYTSVGFDYCNGYYGDSQSFLFSFVSNEIKNPIICHVNNQNNALYYYNGGYGYGYNNSNYSIFNFGNDLSMNNNYISLSSNYNYNNIDLLNDNVNSFNTSEIEAFKIQFNN